MTGAGRARPARSGATLRRTDGRHITSGHGHDKLSKNHGPTPSYVAPGSWEHARRRLELLEACYDATSFM